MGDFPHYFDIILFAMVAAFLVLRLRSVLGRRTGHESGAATIPSCGGRAAGDKDRRQCGSARRPRVCGAAAAADDEAAGRRGGGGARPASAPPIPVSIRPHSCEGARAAFEMIVAAFAAGDKAQLRPLLSDEVYQPFSDAIDEREAAATRRSRRRILQLKSDRYRRGRARRPHGAGHGQVRLGPDQCHARA